MDLEEKKAIASAWFRELRDQICAEFEAIEEEVASKEGLGARDWGLGEGERYKMLDTSNQSSTQPIGSCLNSPLEGESERVQRDPVGGQVGEKSPAKFTRTPWSRPEGGSGEMSIMKGRVFEKVGVNISVVNGEFSEQFRHEIPGASENPKFWAAGISLVAHMASPLVPAAHFNTRMIVVGEKVIRVASKQSSPQPLGSCLNSPLAGESESATRDPVGGSDEAAAAHSESLAPSSLDSRLSTLITPSRSWFGGGGDLNPMVENPEDTADFHAAFQRACDATDLNFYPAFKAWCDEYFYIPHRNEARGVGGIFYDYLGLNRFGADTSPVTSGRFGKGGLTKEATAHGMQMAANANLDWAGGFAFTQAVGRAFAEIYPALIRRHMLEPWTDAQRHHQLVKRGRYAEYNLLYDRGTRFGLMTGGNPDAILMSLPPVAIWE